MSEAAGVGQAGPAEAVTVNHVGEPLHVRAANAQAEVDATAENVDRMRRKVAKAERDAKDIVATAKAGLKQAEADAKAAREHAEALEREAG